MSEDNNNSNNDLSREELNEQLDELRQSQQERKPQKKTRPRWKRRLLGFLGVISGLFLLGTSCSKPTVTCYRHAGPEDEEEAPDNAPNPDSDSNLYDPGLEDQDDKFQGINNESEQETSPDNTDSNNNANAD